MPDQARRGWSGQDADGETAEDWAQAKASHQWHDHDSCQQENNNFTQKGHVDQGLFATVS